MCMETLQRALVRSMFIKNEACLAQSIAGNDTRARLAAQIE